MIKVEKKSTLSGHNGSIYNLAPSQYNNIFFSAAGDGYVVSWDLKDPENGQLIAKVPNSIYAIHYIPSLNQIAVGHNFDGVHFVSWEEKKEIGSVNCTKDSIFSINSYKEFVFVGTGAGELIVVNANSKSIVNRFKLSDKNLRTIQINENLGSIVLGFSDNFIRILSLDELKLKKEFEAHSLSVFKTAFSPDNKLLFSVGRDAQIKVWDAELDYIPVTSIPAHMYAINDIKFSPDGNYFATCSMDKSIKVWDAEKLKLLKVIDKGRHAGHGTSVNSLYWSSFNNYLCSSSDDRTISVWQIGLWEK